MIADWSWLDRLVTPIGTLGLNASSGWRYLTLNQNCSGGADLRVTADMIPQSDGQLNHPQYLTGYTMSLAFALWNDNAPACGRDAQDMLDELGAHLDALRNPTGTTRIIWEPTGLANRMVNDISLSIRPVVTVSPHGDAETIVAVSFSVVSEFPYEMSEAEGTPATLTGGTGIGDTITNDGNTRTWPVFRVYGPTSEFWLENLTTGETLHYDGSRPGAFDIGTGQFVEIDMFRATVVFGGDIDDTAIAGIDFEQTTFWALAAGDNDVALIGADSADILWNAAYL